ncbi:MAG: hypothetical protein IK027_05970, partial [Deltaproteobacteria bacterium]|nr:hypothetical protein [Deltaproteobacteria bacterium]
VVLQTVALGTGWGKEHGGVSLYSEDKNINLDALRTISLHSGQGIFLNTDRGDTGKATWGIGAANNDRMGAKKISDLLPFVAVKTTNRYAEAVSNEEKYTTSTLTADVYTAMHPGNQDYIRISQDLALIHAKNIFLISNNESHMVVNKDNILLSADDGFGISLDKNAKTLTMFQAGASIKLDGTGKIEIKSKESAMLTMNEDLTLAPKAGKDAVIGQIHVNGSTLTAGGNGLIDLGGGQVKIMGTPASQILEEVSTLKDDLEKQKTALEEARDAANASAEEAQAQAKAAAKEALAAQKAREALVAAKN